MGLMMNMDAFRRYYDDIISCKETLNKNADRLCGDDEKRLDALIPIEDEYVREMVKKVIANAVRKNSHLFSEQVCRWSDNALIYMFINESDHVLSEYLPDYLSEEAIEKIANDLMEQERGKEIIKSTDATEFEVVKHDGTCCMLSYKEDEDAATLYACYYAGMEKLCDAQFSNEDLTDVCFHYKDADAHYEKLIKDMLVTQKLDNQFYDFKSDMLKMSPTQIFGNSSWIAAVEDIYYHLRNDNFLSDLQKNLIIDTDKNALIELSEDWYNHENVDKSDELNEIAENYFEKGLEQDETEDIDDDA